MCAPEKHFCELPCTPDAPDDKYGCVWPRDTDDSAGSYEHVGVCGCEEGYEWCSADPEDYNCELLPDALS